MRGQRDPQVTMLAFIDLESRVPPGHPLRTIEVGWEKWTPKSDKIKRRRCQNERGSARKVYQGIPAGSR